MPAAVLASNQDEKKEQDWRIGFMQKRFAKLLEGLNPKFDTKTRNEILEGMGRACAKENSESFNKFKGDIDGFLESLKKEWAEKVEFYKSSKTIRVIGKKQKSCFCPFVSKSVTPREFCNCSIGFNEESFETVIGKPVDVNVEESILRGGERCIFIIRFS